MSEKTIYDWAVEYTGDPASHETRGSEILGFLINEGLEPKHKVFDIGCGSLSQGLPIINYLDPGNYTGLDPNGWLIIAALEKHPRLHDRSPFFVNRTDFTAAGPFDYVISHSVMSHMAHWQMEQALANVRSCVEEGAIWLSSIILDQYNSYDERWVYPGVSKFRLQTMMVLGTHFGWKVDRVVDYEDRLRRVAPNDTHQWLRLTAVPTMEDLNNLRLSETEAADREQHALRIKDELYRSYMDSLDNDS